MRIGQNPNKNLENNFNYIHHVIIPVYIPSLEDYFKESLEILKLCVHSLFATMHSKTFITIIDNGSCEEVVNYLDDLFAMGKLNEVIHTENIGKLNAIVKGVVGHNFPIVTISDADVLFLSDWQKETYKIYETFPKAGVVGLTPQFKSFENFSGNVLFDNLFSSKLRFMDVKNPTAMQKFYESIGWDLNYNHDYLKKHLTISKNDNIAVVGSGHYVATYRKEVLEGFPYYDKTKMGRGSEEKLDKAPLKKDLWRLTTANNYAYHMGNIKEVWMETELDNLYSPQENHFCELAEVSPEISRLGFTKNRIVRKLLKLNAFKFWFYKYKKLPGHMIQNY
ncbi:MAG TPA: glycosyltransferase [Salinimicrobium sp.]|nr:glycosyltransferase [Salinimicrobium sp.]